MSIQLIPPTTYRVKKLSHTYVVIGFIGCQKAVLRGCGILVALTVDFEEVKTAPTECKENASDESSAYLHYSKAPQC